MSSSTRHTYVPAVLFRNTAGLEPVREWYARLTREEQRIVGSDVVFASIAWPLGVSAAPRRDLWEVRSRLPGKRIGRILVSFRDGQLVLLHGLEKLKELSDKDLDVGVRRQQETDNGGEDCRHLGSFFDSHLENAGLLGEATLIAWKRKLASEVTQAMEKQGITKSEMAKRMATSRSQLDRLLDPDNPNVLLETVQKAAVVVGKRLSIDLVDEPRR